MDITNKKIWQIGAGDTDRSYANLCLDWDIILDGPGEKGPWPNCRPALKGIDSDKKITDLKRFCEDIKAGDLVVLRIGTTHLYGVGEVEGDYFWSDHFGDIDGWNLQHARRVKWLWKYTDQGTPQIFNAYALKWGDTVQELDPGPVKDWINSLTIPSQNYSRSIKTLPDPQSEPKEIDVTKIGEFLFDKGISVNSIETLTNQMDDLIRIAHWYQRADIKPSERETIAYLVVPLLRSLGWTPQKMAIEWNNVDLALFSQMPRKDDNLSVVVEVKRKDWSCLTAKSQAEQYATQPGRGHCRRLIVTEGIRYGVYLREEGGKFSEYPSAYLNLTRLRDKYPILYDCGGARDAFLLMASDWNG